MFCHALLSPHVGTGNPPRGCLTPLTYIQVRPVIVSVLPGMFEIQPRAYLRSEGASLRERKIKSRYMHQIGSRVRSSHGSVLVSICHCPSAIVLVTDNNPSAHACDVFSASLLQRLRMLRPHLVFPALSSKVTVNRTASTCSGAP